MVTGSDAFRDAVKSLEIGKRLPTALYFCRTLVSVLPECLRMTLGRAESAAEPDPGWNLLKLHTDQYSVTFLSYPAFDVDPHPGLVEATKINLNTGTVVRTDYRTRANVCCADETGGNRRSSRFFLNCGRTGLVQR